MFTVDLLTPKGITPLYTKEFSKDEKGEILKDKKGKNIELIFMAIFDTEKQAEETIIAKRFELATQVQVIGWVVKKFNAFPTLEVSKEIIDKKAKEFAEKVAIPVMTSGFVQVEGMPITSMGKTIVSKIPSKKSISKSKKKK